MPNFASICGTIIGVGLNLSPGILFYEFFKGKRELTTIPEMMFIMGVFCNTINLAYGLLIKDINLYISSAICEIIQIIYSTVYLFLYSGNDFSKWILYVFIAYNLTLETLYFFYDVLAFHTSVQFADDFTGWLNVFITILNAGAPGQKIIETWKTGNFILIPIYTTIAQNLCSIFWAIYGFIVMNIKIYFPNVFGVVLSGIQIFTYFYFYIKNKGVPPKKKNEEDKSDEQPDSGTTKFIKDDKQDANERTGSTEEI